MPAAIVIVRNRGHLRSTMSMYKNLTANDPDSNVSFRRFRYFKVRSKNGFERSEK